MNIRIPSNIVACPLCNSDITAKEDKIKCDSCDYDSTFIGDNYNLIPYPINNEEITNRFKYIDDAIDDTFAKYATYLTLGYIPNDNKQLAIIEPERFCFNRYSTKLLLEVIGEYNFSDKKFVEVGSGRGGNIEAINKYYNPQFSLGIDISPANVDFCNSRYQLPNAYFVLGDAENLPLKSDLYDVVLNLESAHYYPNINHFFSEVYRVLKKGGQLLFADILTVETFAQIKKHLKEIGFTVTRDHDISENVILSCNEIAVLKQKNTGTKLYDTFTVLPGDQVYADLVSGVKRYKILNIVK